jgi:alpha-amylase
MTDIVFIFEVHQPFRLKRNFFWDHEMFKRVSSDRLFDFYFDKSLDREVFNRVAGKCYLPSNRILLDAIDEHRTEKRKFEVAFSLSGIFIEQCERFNKDVLDSFKQLSETGCVEFLCQTYYHSLSSLYVEGSEFEEEVNLHRGTMRDTLKFDPVVFENTELIYNNSIAKRVERMGFKAIVTEGVESTLGWRSPNYVYSAKGCDRLKVLLRNYRLTDDVGFRFSARWWNQWPLTADKYASWLAATPGQCIVIFPDYETFGEHHWSESGIHDFLRHLPGEILKWDHLSFSTPSKVVDKHHAVGEINVPEKLTISWGGVKRDVSSWLENTMQWAYHVYLQKLEPLVKESDDENLLKVWRYLQASDHLHNMYATGGPSGKVHAYFNPFESPTHAYTSSMSVLADFESKLRLAVIAADHPFVFYEAEDKPTKVKAHSLRGFLKALDRVSDPSLEFHVAKGDFERWVELSLHDPILAQELERIKESEACGAKLREALKEIVRKRWLLHRPSTHRPPK